MGPVWGPFALEELIFQLVSTADSRILLGWHADIAARDVLVFRPGHLSWEPRHRFTVTISIQRAGLFMTLTPAPNSPLPSSRQSAHATEASAPQRPTSDFRIGRLLVDARYPDIAEQDREPLMRRIFTHIDFLRATYPNIHDVREKRILDLACGATSYQDNGRGKYDPWMSRVLRHLGAHPVGVDICPQHHEGFESHTADLNVPDALSFLPTGSFDAVYVCAFPTRKSIQNLVERGVEWAPIRDNLAHHLNRCLKPDGKIIRQFSPADERLVEEAVAFARARMPHPCSDDEL